MNYKFVLVDPATGSDRVRWILPPPVVVGRCPTADICIADPSISRRHCQFSTNSEGSLVVRDLGSLNGVYIGDERVEKGIVCPGTEVRIGGVTLRAEFTEEAADKPLPVVTYEVDATRAMKIVRVIEDES
jgi:pSer/pThr/pTyr-binding forkhead associated (FHA) protein